MRLHVFVMLACASCSTEPSSAAPTFHRDCVAPNVKPCSGLAILTPREPIPLSSVPVGPLLLRGDAIDAFQAPSLLQHYALDGTPPRLHATSNVLLTLGLQYGTIATDGVELFAFDQSQFGDDLRIWNSANIFTVGIHVSDGIDGNEGSLAAYQGLALVHQANYGPTDLLRLYDDQGTLGWSHDGVALTPYAYGCGFALVDNGYLNETLTMMPLDGRASTEQRVEFGAPAPWPYDSHAVALALYEVHGGGDCSTGILLAFDDGRPSITHTFARDCATIEYSSDVTIVTSSFGPVLHQGAGTFVLLGGDGNPIGAPIEVGLGGDFQQIVVVPGTNAIAVVSTEQVAPSSNEFATYETVIGCAP